MSPGIGLPTICFIQTYLKLISTTLITSIIFLSKWRLLDSRSYTTDIICWVHWCSLCRGLLLLLIWMIPLSRSIGFIQEANMFFQKWWPGFPALAFSHQTYLGVPRFSSRPLSRSQSSSGFRQLHHPSLVLPQKMWPLVDVLKRTLKHPQTVLMSGMVAVV